MDMKRFILREAHVLAFVGTIGLVTAGCSTPSPGDPEGAGGGSPSGAAGTTGSAGSTGAAGAPGVAGAPGTAGRIGEGGTTGAAGAITPSGGRGGGTAGRAGAGGSSVPRGGSGGSVERGGAGGAPTTTGAAGAGGATPSSGCGKTPPASMRYSIDVSGMSREYILSVPSNYNPSTPYRLIFAWHPWGGSAQQVAGTGNSGYYGLKGTSNNQAILVSPEGLDFNGQGLGWGNTNGRDIAFLKAMLDRFKSEMCVDESRVFSTGFSFGGMMSNAVACAGLARAVAPMAGNSTVSGCTSGTQPVAYMGFHGTHDSVVDIAGGRTARDVFVKRNGCTSQTTPSSPSWCEGIAASYQPCSCVTYEGCAAGYPVTWCEYNADHQAAPNSGATLWPFFSQF
jgi:polyhydroxybutyrate depolymerase